MKLKIVGGLILAGILLALTPPATAQAQRSDAKVKVETTADKAGDNGQQVVTIKLAVAKGWHIYANPVVNADLANTETKVTAAANGEIVKVSYPPGRVVKDSIVGDYSVYEDDVVIKATVQRAAGPLELSIFFQACDDKSCLLPATVKVTVP